MEVKRLSEIERLNKKELLEYFHALIQVPNAEMTSEQILSMGFTAAKLDSMTGSSEYIVRGYEKINQMNCQR